MNHERIHLRQQLELLVIGFYIIYLTEFFIRLLINWNPYIAYRSISFEQEAYEYDKEMDYLMRRDYFASFKKRYFRKQF